MVSRAIARYVRVSPRKVRQVVDLIRGANVDSAFDILANVNKGAAFHVEQALKSAVDSAIKKTEGKADPSNLLISRITADGGPMLKRYKAATMGRAMMIRRRTAHILIELDTIRPIVEARPKGRTAKTKMVEEKTAAKKKAVPKK